MYNGIGLTTPRGSGTNGYVMRNLAYIKQKPKFQYDYNSEEHNSRKALREPNKEILLHACKRQIEVKVLEFQEALEEEQSIKRASTASNNVELLSDEEIRAKVQEYRDELLRDGVKDLVDVKKLKEHETHQLSQAKLLEMEKMKAAFKISPSDAELNARKRMGDFAGKEAAKYYGISSQDEDGSLEKELDKPNWLDRSIPFKKKDKHFISSTSTSAEPVEKQTIQAVEDKEDFTQSNNETDSERETTTKSILEWKTNESKGTETIFGRLETTSSFPSSDNEQNSTSSFFNVDKNGNILGGKVGNISWFSNFSLRNNHAIPLSNSATTSTSNE